MEKLDLFDVSVHEKDWKQYRKSASQEELLILGIGVKYRLITKRLVSYLSALGIMLSVIIGLVLISSMEDMSAGLIVLVAGYAVFSFLATKFIRYNDSLSQINRRLDKENKAALKSVFNVSAAAGFFDGLVRALIMFITLPYQAVLMFIGMFAPNFVIAKNGVLIAIPKGYDIGNLASAGEYYASRSLLDDWRQTSYNENHRYKATFINDMGCEQTVYSADGKSFYTDGGSYVGQSDDNGKTIKTK